MESHLDKIIAATAKEQNKEKATVLKELKHREKQGRAWNKIGFVTKKLNKSHGITRLGIPKGFEDRSSQEIWEYLYDPTVKPEWVYITDKATIKKRLVEWQYLYYS